MLEVAARLGVAERRTERDAARRRQFSFEPVLKRMSTVDERDGELWIDTKGAPEAVLPCCGTLLTAHGIEPLAAERVAEIEREVREYAGGLLGNGCVGEVFSVGMLVCGTAFSGIGQIG